MKHALVVDDDAGQCIIIYTWLVQLGFIVTICHNVLEAMNSITTRKADVLIVDLMMPEISGFELIEWIRSHDKNMPIVVISAYIDIESKQKAFQLGSNYYITKPYTKEDINRVFTQYL